MLKKICDKCQSEITGEADGAADGTFINFNYPSPAGEVRLMYATSEGPVSGTTKEFDMCPECLIGLLRDTGGQSDD